MISFKLTKFVTSFVKPANFIHSSSFLYVNLSQSVELSMWKLRKLWKLCTDRRVRRVFWWQKAARLAKRAVDRISQAGSRGPACWLQIDQYQSRFITLLSMFKGCQLANKLQWSSMYISIDDDWWTIQLCPWFRSFNEHSMHHARKNLMAWRFFRPLLEPWIRSRLGLTACAKCRWRAGSPTMQET